MALPTSRNTTYAAGSQVKSADLNDLQDQVVALETARAGLQADLTAAEADLTAAESDIDALQAADVTLQSNIDAVEDLIRATRTRWISPSGGSTDLSGTHWYMSDSCVKPESPNDLNWAVPLILDTGERLLSVGGRVVDASGVTITMSLYRVALTGTRDLLGDDTSAGDGGQESLVVDELTHDVLGSGVYVAQFESSGFHADLALIAVWMTVSRPA